MACETIRDGAVKACFMELTQHLGNESQLCSCHLTALLLSNAAGNQGLEMYKTCSAIVKGLVFALNYTLLGFLGDYAAYSGFDSFSLTLN